MSQTALTFSDGGTATLRDPRLVPVKVRRLWERASAPLASIKLDLENQFTDEAEIEKRFKVEAMNHLEAVDASTDAAVLALVQEWSYGPVNQDTLDNLPAETFDVLADQAQKLAPQMRANFKPQTETDPKAESPESVGTPITPEPSA